MLCRLMLGLVPIKYEFASDERTSRLMRREDFKFQNESVHGLFCCDDDDDHHHNQLCGCNKHKVDHSDMENEVGGGCGKVDGKRVIHYGTTLEEIAEEFGTTADMILDANGYLKSTAIQL